MSQFDFGTIDPNSKSGPQLALDLNKFRDALNSGHRGSTRPAYAQAGMQWVRETSSTQWDLMLFDGDTDFVLRSINPTTNTLIGIPQSQIEGLSATFSGLDSKYVGKDSPTGAATLPSGTTAQRPAAPVAGMTRYNTTLAEYERYQGGAWVPLNVMDKALNEAPVVTIASASTVNIGAATANTINISGTVTITSLGTIAAGATRRLVFQGALTLTHNAASLILPGAANITTAAGDVAEFVSLGGGSWKCLSYMRANALPVMAADKSQCTAWVNFNGAGTVAIRDSLNVSSITDNGVGTYTVNFSAAMENANYAASGSCALTGNATMLTISGQLSASASIRTSYLTSTQPGNAVDPTIVNMSVFGGK